jgi:hypothetical protein
MMKRSWSLLILVGAASLVVGWRCPGEDHGPGHQDATVPAPDSGVCDPCASGQTIFGPETFTRQGCQPETVERDLEVPADGNLCFLLTSDGTSAAWIKLDGAKVFGPNAFNPNVTQLSTTVEATAGMHTLSVRITSKKGSSVTIEVRACGDTTTPPEEPLCSEVATDWCTAKGWTVADSSAYPGNLICTAPGVPEDENCSGCGEYNIVVWEDGSGDRFCPDVTYTTTAGNFYCGHNPCVCGDNLVLCGTWGLQGCIPD